MRPLDRTTIKVKFLPPTAAEPIEKKLSFVSSGVLNYFNSQHLLYPLGKDARAFYDFLCEVMNNDNNITIDAALKRSFSEYFYRLTSNKKRIPLNSLGNYVSKLVDQRLLIPMGNTGSAFYCINPKYAFKGTKAERRKLLIKLIQTRGAAGLTLKGLINSPDSLFIKSTHQ